MLNNLLLGLAIIALVGVLLEEKIHIGKAKIALFFGCIAWLLMFIAATGEPTTAAIAEAFGENISEIANLWLFLIAAMTFVAYLNKKGLIDAAIRRLLPHRMSERQLMFFTVVFCFAFSSLADNITATLVSLALIQTLDLKQSTIIKLSVAIVFSVNSGGVSLISGDVTTLMIFLADKVTIPDLLKLALPSFAAVLVLATLLGIGLRDTITIERRAPRLQSDGSDRRETRIRRLDIAIAIVFLATIISSMVLNVVSGVPPVLTFLTGLSIMFIMASLVGEDIEQDPIMDYIRLVEFDTLLFFLGILLLVGMLEQIGALAALASGYEMFPPVAASYAAGITSAFVDNVPLTAALLKAEPALSVHEWLPLTYAVGVGGSLLVVGSAAGIVCMSKVPGLTVLAYLRYFPAVLVAYSVGYAGSVWVSAFVR